MSEYLLAILQENSLNQRNTGLKDADLLEIYEISVEVIALNEELNKKTTFADLANKIIEDNKTRPADSAYFKQHEQGGGDSCCAPGQPQPKDAEQVVRSLIMRLNEVIFEILAEAPFAGNTVIQGTNAGEAPFMVNSEQLISSICDFTARLTGTKGQQKRKVTMDGCVKGIAITDSPKVGDLFTVQVHAEKLKFVKHDGPKQILHVCLANLTTGQTFLETCDPTEQKVTQEFQMMLSQRGINKIKAFTFTGDGQMDSTFPKDQMVE